MSFALDVPGKDGHTPRTHLETAYRMSRRLPKRLAEAQVPEWGAYLVQLFHDMAAGRGSTGWGPAAIGWAEVEAWTRLRRLHLDAWEIDILRRLDHAWLHAHYARTP